MPVKRRSKCETTGGSDKRGQWKVLSCCDNALTIIKALCKDEEEADVLLTIEDDEKRCGICGYERCLIRVYYGTEDHRRLGDAWTLPPLRQHLAELTDEAVHPQRLMNTLVALFTEVDIRINKLFDDHSRESHDLQLEFDGVYETFDMHVESFGKQFRSICRQQQINSSAVEKLSALHQGSVSGFLLAAAPRIWDWTTFPFLRVKRSLGL